MKSIGHWAVAFGVGMVLLVCACCGVGTWMSWTLGRALEESIVTTRRVQAIMNGDMMHDAIRADVLSAFAAKDPTTGFSFEAAQLAVTEHAKQFQEDVAECLSLASDEGQQAKFSALADVVGKYIESAQTAIRQIEEDPAGAAMTLGGFLETFTRLETTMAQIGEELELSQAQHAAQYLEMEHWSIIYMTLLTALAIAAVALMGWLVRKLLVSPLVLMTGAMRRLVKGETELDLPATHRKDEIGAMAATLVAFREALVERRLLEADADARAAHVTNLEAAARQTARDQATVLQSLAASLTSLAAGDLTTRISGTVSPAYETLKGDFNRAMDALESALGIISVSARTIQVSTAELAVSSDDLAERTTRQAASLEETSAAADQVTATVRKSADETERTRLAVVSVDADARQSASIVEATASAMDAIARSSRQIGQIVEVIDEMAFQTNLLALNAGVEAARAGEAGRGFAVVAMEVRSLAQRCTKAASEIKQLIVVSSQTVDDGIGLVKQTAESLMRIAGRIADVNAAVADAAQSSREQSAGLDHINVAINSMDSVTQQNAVMVEQATRSTRAIADETKELLRLVGRFQIDIKTEEPEAVAPPSRPRPVRVAAARSPALALVDRLNEVDDWKAF